MLLDTWIWEYALKIMWTNAAIPRVFTYVHVIILVIDGEVWVILKFVYVYQLILR